MTHITLPSLPENNNSEIAIIANKIESGLAAFEKRKTELIELKAEAHGLKIESIDDKVTIQAVSIIRKKLKVARVEIEKEGKLMRDPLTRINKTISEKEKELVAIIEPTERELLAQENWVESEKKRIREEDERAEEARIQKRIDTLAQYGFSIDITFIRTISDEDFEKVVDNARIEHKKELAAKAEADRLAKIQAQQLIDERKELEELRKKQAEAQRIIDEQNKKIRREQEEKEATIRADQKKIEDEKREANQKNIAIRYQRLADCGMGEGAMRFTYNGLLNIEKTSIEKMTDEVFEKAILNAKSAIQQLITVEEQKRKNELEQARKEAAEKERLRLIEQEKLAKIESQEKLAAASDKIKWQTVIEQIGSITIPEMKSAKAKKLGIEVNQMLAELTGHIIANTKTKKEELV